MLLPRTLKLIPITFIQSLIGRDLLNGVDGELIVKPPTVATTYNTSVKGVMSRDGEPPFTFWVFDLHDCPIVPYQARYEALEKRVKKLPKDFQAVVQTSTR